MQGRVTIDFGNTNPHAGVFLREGRGWNFLKSVPWAELPLYLHQLELTPHNTTMALAAVRDRPEELQKLLEQGFLITKLRDYWRGKSFAGMKVEYAESLGEDRLIEAYYCYKKSQLPTLLIDAGTFVTIDVVNSGGFRGGFILPGTSSYADIFNRGEQLTQVSPDFAVDADLPLNTAAAMGRGYLAFTHLVLELIKVHAIKKVMITGGQGEWWHRTLAPKLPELVIETNPDLIHIALQYWMDTQIELL